MPRRKPPPRVAVRLNAICDLDVSAKHKAVLHALSRYADVSDRCKPSIYLIARGASLPRRTTQRILADLKSWGFFITTRLKGSNLYVLTLPDAPTNGASHAPTNGARNRVLEQGKHNAPITPDDGDGLRTLVNWVEGDLEHRMN